MIQKMSEAEQNCQTQSGPKHCEKSSDLRRCLKTVSDIDKLSLDGRLFHMREATTRNDPSPMVECITLVVLDNCEGVQSHLKILEFSFRN